ncbi:MAG: hypothetical protein FWF96_06025, partial [Kiritimatiellaeota bacterium]|nr:hypothetical protein [Kiritimatiellota bacterium]
MTPATTQAFTRHGDFEYRFDLVEFSETLKVAGVPKYHGGVADFICEYLEKYEPLMKDSDTVCKPYAVMCVWSSLLGEKRENAWESGDRIFGCLVRSLDNLPEGMIGADLGLKKFLVMTLRGRSMEEVETLVNYPTDRFKEWMPKEYADALYPPIPEVNWHFQIDVDGKETQFMSY